jgi:hypothetical protein
MPKHARSRVDKAALSQLPLPFHADIVGALDQQQRKIVVAVLARLLLKAAGMAAAGDETDDAE